MAVRTFQDYTRGSVTLTDYFKWRDEGGRAACENSTNPAFLSAMASEEDIQSAQATCAGCPLLAGCDFFAHTKHFRDFDGVMGGTLFMNALDDNYGQTDTSDEMEEASV